MRWHFRDRCAVATDWKIVAPQFSEHSMGLRNRPHRASSIDHRRNASAGTSSGVTNARRLFCCKIAVTRKIGTVSWDWTGLSERAYFALLATISLLSGASAACDTV